MQANGKYIYLDPEYENVWTETAYYSNPGDTVLYGGYIYKAITFNTGLKPANIQLIGM